VLEEGDTFLWVTKLETRLFGSSFRSELALFPHSVVVLPANAQL
jgi:hypothetical protein